MEERYVVELNNEKLFGSSKDLPLFQNIRTDDLHTPLPSFKEFSCAEIRSELGTADPKLYKYVILPHGQLVVSNGLSTRIPLDEFEFKRYRHFDRVFPLELDGQRFKYCIDQRGDLIIFDYHGRGPLFKIIQLKHPEISRLKPVIAAGDFYTLDGYIISSHTSGREGINNWTGHFLVEGEHLPKVVEHVFMRHGYREAEGCFVDRVALSGGRKTLNEPIIIPPQPPLKNLNISSYLPHATSAHLEIKPVSTNIFPGSDTLFFFKPNEPGLHRFEKSLNFYMDRLLANDGSFAADHVMLAEAKVRLQQPSGEPIRYVVKTLKQQYPSLPHHAIRDAVSLSVRDAFIVQPPIKPPLTSLPAVKPSKVTATPEYVTTKVIAPGIELQVPYRPPGANSGPMASQPYTIEAPGTPPAPEFNGRLARGTAIGATVALSTLALGSNLVAERRAYPDGPWIYNGIVAFGVDTFCYSPLIFLGPAAPFTLLSALPDGSQMAKDAVQELMDHKPTDWRGLFRHQALIQHAGDAILFSSMQKLSNKIVAPFSEASKEIKQDLRDRGAIVTPNSPKSEFLNSLVAPGYFDADGPIYPHISGNRSDKKEASVIPPESPMPEYFAADPSESEPRQLQVQAVIPSTTTSSAAAVAKQTNSYTYNMQPPLQLSFIPWWPVELYPYKPLNVPTKIYGLPPSFGTNNSQFYIVLPDAPVAPSCIPLFDLGGYQQAVFDLSALLPNFHEKVFAASDAPFVIRTFEPPIPASVSSISMNTILKSQPANFKIPPPKMDSLLDKVKKRTDDFQIIIKPGLAMVIFNPASPWGWGAAALVVGGKWFFDRKAEQKQKKLEGYIESVNNSTIQIDNAYNHIQTLFKQLSEAKDPTVRRQLATTIIKEVGDKHKLVYFIDKKSESLEDKKEDGLKKKFANSHREHWKEVKISAISIKECAQLALLDSASLSSKITSISDANIKTFGMSLLEQLCYSEASSALKNQNWSDALRITNLFLVHDPLNSTLLTQRGNAQRLTNTDAAIVDYSIAIKQDPNNHAAYQGATIAYLDKKDFNNAFTVLIHAEQKFSDVTVKADLNNLRRLGQDKLVEHSMMLIDTNQWKLVEVILTDQNFAMTVVDTKLITAYNFFKQKDFHKAIPLLQEALKLEPNNPLVHHYLAKSFSAEADFLKAKFHEAKGLLISIDTHKEALAIANDVLANYPNNTEFLSIRAYALFEQDPKKAQLDYRKIIELSPDSSVGYIGLMRTQLVEEDFAAAFATLTTIEGKFAPKTHALTPSEVPSQDSTLETENVNIDELKQLAAGAFVNFASKKLRGGDRKVVFDYIDSNQVVLSETDRTIVNACDYFEAGNAEIAIQLLQSVIKTNPENHRSKDVLIQLYTRLTNKYIEAKEHGKAINCLIELINLNPSSQLYHTLGDQYFAIKYFDNALSCYEESVKLEDSVELRQKVFMVKEAKRHDDELKVRHVTTIATEVVHLGIAAAGFFYRSALQSQYNAIPTYAKSPTLPNGKKNLESNIFYDDPDQKSDVVSKDHEDVTIFYWQKK